MAVLHITDYDVLTLTHDLDNKRGDGMKEWKYPKYYDAN